VLREHYRWVEVASEHGAEPVRLPLSGNYVIDTSENHSELHGPYAAGGGCSPTTSAAKETRSTTPF